MSNSTTKKSAPVTLPPLPSKSSLWKPPINDVQPQSSRFQAEEDTAGWQAPPNMGLENNSIMRSLQGSIQAECEDCAASEKEPQIQTKLTVGAPGDTYEQEADRVAAQVMSMSDHSPQVQRFGEAKTPIQMWSEQLSTAPVVQRQIDEQVQMRELVQRAFQGGGTQASGELERRLSSSKGGGSALAPEVRAFMEPRFGADFSGVRVHTGGDAVQMNRELGAQAFTHGSDVYYGAGKSPGNNELTAHELTHVVQQTGVVQRQTNIVQIKNQSQLAPYAVNAKQDESSATKILQLRSQFALLQARINQLKNRVHLARKISFPSTSWAKLARSGQQLSGLLNRLPFPVPGGLTTAVPALMASVEATTSAGVILPALAAEAVLGVLAELAAVIAAALADALLVILIGAAIILLLYLVYLAINAIVEAIEEAIEKMRYQPPIFWSTSLPLPGPIGMPLVRTKPPNPRIPGGGQDIVRSRIRASGQQNLMVAHHVLPLFLGGTDILANVIPWLKPLHLIGHPSLQVQPQMVVWGYSINIYDHPPPGGYFIAGVKSP